MHWEHIFCNKAELQYGLVARFQLPAMGCTVHDWWAALRSNRWCPVSPRVAARTGAPASDAQRVLAAVLDASPGAVLHHPSALAWLGLRGFSLRHIQVARPRGLNGHPPALARVHRLRAIRAPDVIVVRGVPTETALRAIWSEAAKYAKPIHHDIGAEKIGALLDAANRLGLVTWEALNESVDDLQQRGRAGTVIMRALAGERPPGSSPTDSRQENQFEKLLREAGERPFRRQPVLGGNKPIGRCDHRDDDLPLAIEVNSEVHHTTPSDRAADIARYAALNDAGFTVGVVWEYDLWSRPFAAVELARHSRRAAREGRRIVLHSPGCPWPEPLPTTHVVL